MDSRGKVVMESILETKAATILEFFAGLRGTLSVTFEEGTWAAWLYDLLKPHVAKLVVCNPRDRKSTRLNSSHSSISYAVFCLKKKKNNLSQPAFNIYKIHSNRSFSATDHRNVL